MTEILMPRVRASYLHLEGTRILDGTGLGCWAQLLSGFAWAHPPTSHPLVRIASKTVKRKQFLPVPYEVFLQYHLLWSRVREGFWALGAAFWGWGQVDREFSGTLWFGDGGEKGKWKTG